MTIEVLDHGYVRLVSYTQPVPIGVRPTYGYDGPAIGEEVGRSLGWTGDLEIVRAARVSYNADWRDETDLTEPSKDAKLIRYLWKNAHTSPFEAMTFSFEVQAPIFVFRQWHRHRTQSYNEVSARYTELPDLFYVPDFDQVRAQSKTNKQGRDELLDERSIEAFRREVVIHSNAAYYRYQEFLALGVARELARLVLPVNTYSRMYASANLLNWFRFLTLRMDAHAQYEIRTYAGAICELLGTVCPIAVDTFKDSLGYVSRGLGEVKKE
jgi:thymidylate synthase (FAD)